MDKCGERDLRTQNSLDPSKTIGKKDETPSLQTNEIHY